MPKRQKHEDLYWNDAETDSEGSYDPRAPPLDPWDLENYAYIREHLDSAEMSSSPSLPISASSGGEIINSSSFFYVPGNNNNNNNNNNNDISGDYADIEEVTYMSKRSAVASRRKNSYYDYFYHEEPENPYELGTKDRFPLASYGQSERCFRRASMPLLDTMNYNFQSSSDYDYGCYGNYGQCGDATLPIYDDVRRLRANSKPKNFSLTNYGHLKIDYSLSWNDLNKYIRFHS